MSEGDTLNYSGSSLRFSKEQLREISSDFKKSNMEDEQTYNPSGLKKFVNPKKKSIPARIGFKKSKKKSPKKSKKEFFKDEKEPSNDVEEKDYMPNQENYQDDLSQSISHYLNDEDLELLSDNEDNEDKEDLDDYVTNDLKENEEEKEKNNNVLIDNTGKKFYKLQFQSKNSKSGDKSKSSETLLSILSPEGSEEDSEGYPDSDSDSLEAKYESSSLNLEYEDDELEKVEGKDKEENKDDMKQVSSTTSSNSGFLDEDNSFFDSINNRSLKKSASLDFDHIMEEQIKRRQEKEQKLNVDSQGSDPSINFIVKAKSLPNFDEEKEKQNEISKNNDKEKKEKRSRRNTVPNDFELKKSSSVKLMKEREKRLDSQKIVELQKLKELEEKERLEKERAKRSLLELKNKKRRQQSKIESIESEISRRQSRKINENQFVQKLLIDNFQEYKHLRQFEPNHKCIHRYLEIKLSSKRLHDRDKLALFNIMCKDILNMLTLYEIIGLLETGFSNFKIIIKNDNHFKMNVYQIFQKNYSEKIQLIICHILQILMNLGFDFNKYFQDMFVIKPLSFCMIYENNLIAYFLIRNYQVPKNEVNNPIYKFQVKKLDEKISTLGLAVVHRNIDGIKLLLIHGATINVKKKDYYRNEIKIAKKKKYNEIVKLLEDHIVYNKHK